MRCKPLPSVITIDRTDPEIHMEHTRFASFAIILLVFSTILLPLIMFAPIARALTLYNSGDPTSDEQLVLEYINRARANPIAEGQRLGIDIHEGLSDPSLVGPRPPLAMNPILLNIATAHTQDMYNQNYFSHNDPNGTTPFDRMTHAGYNYAMAGENMAGGEGMSSNQLEDFMMVDSGTPGRPHRVNLLDIFPYPCGNPPCIYSEIGIGYLNAPTPDGQGLSSLITQDFGATGTTGPFLLGVVYNDLNGNNFYDIGEGISGVTITPSTGTYYAVSSSSGGYAIPIGTSGTITVTASGPGFGPITKTVTLTGTNIKVDFTTSSQTITTTSTQTTTSSTSTVATTSPSQTATSTLTVPSITINPTSAETGSVIDITGFGFSTADVTCSLSGNAVGTSTCSISNGVMAASFVVANVAAGLYTITASGIEAGDSVSSTLTVSASSSQTTTTTSAYATQTSNSTTSSTTYSTTTSTQSSTTSTSTAKTPDFLLTSSTSTITMTQGGSGSATITIYPLNGFSSTVTLTSSWVGSVPAGVIVSITSPVTSGSGGAATSPLIVTANTTAISGTYIIQVTGTSNSQSHIVTANVIVQQLQSVSTSSTTINSATSMTSMTSTSPTLPANCPVSYAVSGSELGPLAEELRVFRDQSIMKTRSGLAFMILFNSWYYSFAPSFASYLRLHPTQRDLLRYVLYPLIGVLYVSHYTYLFVSPFSVDGGALMAGIVAASLLGLMYFAPIAYVVICVIRRYMKFLTLSLSRLSIWFGFSVPIVGIAYSMNPQLLGISIANLLLCILAMCSILGIQALSYLQIKCNNILRE